MSDHWMPGHDGRPREATHTALQERDLTPDGVPLAGWWRRWFAWIVDGIVVGIPASGLALLVSLGRPDVWLDALQRGRSVETWLSPHADELGRLLTSAACLLVASAFYSILMTSRLGWTLGKRLLGMRVRHRDHERLPTTAEAATRWAVQLAPNAISQMPGIGGPASLWVTIDGLWAAWDPRRQAIHDKAAGTSVVLAWRAVPVTP